MNKNSYIFFVLILFLSCKSAQKKTAEVNSDILFALETSSCMGECPVFQVKLFSDSTYTFKGIKNTQLEDAYSVKLEKQEYDQFLIILSSVKWDKLNEKYEDEMMMDLPTRRFFYHLSDDSISVHQNSLKPLELTQLSDSVLKWSVQIFTEK